MDNFGRQREIEDSEITEMTEEFEQEQLGELMALDVAMTEQPDVFSRQIGDPENYDIFSTGDVGIAEIASVQAAQSYDDLSQKITAGHNNPETRKELALADQYAQRIDSMVRDVLVSEGFSLSLTRLSDMKQTVLSYDLPKGLEHLQKQALKSIYKAQQQVFIWRNSGADMVWDDRVIDHASNAKSTMEFIQGKIDRLERIEKYSDFGDMSSDEIQEYAEQQRDLAQEKLFDDTISDEEALKGLENAHKAMQELPKVIAEEEQQQKEEEIEIDRIIWEESGVSLTQTQLEMCGYLQADYPDVELNCIKMFYEENASDYDRVETDVAAFSLYLEENFATDQRTIFFQFMDDKNPENEVHDINDNLVGLCEDYPAVQKNIVQAIYLLTPDDFDRVQDRVSDFSHYAEKHNWTRQNSLYMDFITQL